MTRARRALASPPLLLAGVLVLVSAVLGGRGAGAQPRARPILIGALTESWGATPALVGLRDGLVELGYRENQDFVIGVRFTEGGLAELPVAARQLVELGADILVTAAAAATAAKAAQMATDRIPIVFIGGSDPVGMGLVQSLARPGGNITGVADLDTELTLKRLEIFREIIPGLKRVLLPYDAADAYALSLLEAHRAAARRLGLTLVERSVRTEEEARVIVAGLRKGEVDGILSPRVLSLNIPGFILDAAPRRNLPTMFYSSWHVDRGGLASYSANNHDLGRKAARLVDKIIKGAKPAGLPVEQATTFELVINLKIAKALGLTIPRTLVLKADRLIE